MLYIGIDDTDSLKGMCTTYLMTEVIKIALNLGIDIIGYPRLVRLNPSIPWKTRGNAALALALGHGYGREFCVGNIEGTPVFAYPKGRGKIERAREFFEEVCRLVEKNACFDEENTNPGIVMVTKKPRYRFYLRGVREIVSKEEVLREIEGLGGEWRGYKNMRGLVGAFCAIAWKPLRATYEILAYRKREYWGTERKIDEKSVIEMDKNFKTTFNNYDYENRRIAIAPHSPCPILFGIRASVPDELFEAMSTVKGEEIARWFIFCTNQATDDHIVRKKISMCKPGDGVRIRGKVKGMPKVLEGGHVVFRVCDSSGEIDCTIYEPSKQLTRIGRQLVAGDVVEVFGCVREHPRTVNVEKLHVVRAISLLRKLSNPLCEKCGKRMKSKGRNAGFECVKCGARKGAQEAEWEVIRREGLEGWYEPAVCSRRHLSKPLKLMLQSQSLS